MRKPLITIMITVLTIFAIGLIGTSTANAKKWHYGIGTGIKFMNVEGEEGFNISSFGPVLSELDLDASDISDMMESAIGLGGFATDGTWMIKASFGIIKLGGEPSGSLPAGVGGGTFTADYFYEITTAQFTLGYTSYRSADMKFSLTPFAGVRYMKHDIGAELDITQGATTIAIAGGVEHNWTDFLFGTSIGYRLSPKLSWSAQGDVGLGGSEGTYSFGSGLSWKALKHVSIGPSVFYSAIEVVNGVASDSDWYFYDANEFGAAINVMISW